MLSQFIAKLLDFQLEHGDSEVRAFDQNWYDWEDPFVMKNKSVAVIVGRAGD